MMKYLNVMLALCLLLSASALAVAATPNPADNLQVSVTAVAEKSVEISLTNLRQQRTTVTIESLDGSVLYFEDIVKKHNGYRKRLNLKDLEDGKYLLTVQQGTEKRQQVIVLKEDRGMLLSSIR